MSDYHLVRDRLDPDAVYFETAEFDLPWGGFGEPRPVVRSYRRPLGAVLNPLVDSGLVLDRLLEPLPTDDCRDADPDVYAELMQRPDFLCVRAIKPR